MNHNNISSLEEVLMNKIVDFYSKPQYLYIFKEIVVNQKFVSLRLLDFFSTNYTRYNRKDNNFYFDYKCQLKSYKKIHFDPFCRIHRRQRILLRIKNKGITLENINNHKNQKISLEYKFLTNENIQLKENEFISTTGQLNFFRWFIENNVLIYVQEHLDEINHAMIKEKNIQLKKSNLINKKQKYKNKNEDTSQIS